MPTTWTPERINQLLLLVIKVHYQGTPDYKFIAAQLGVTAEAARLQFSSLRRNFTLPQSGTVQPAEPKPRTAKRKSKVKEDSDEDINPGGKRLKRERKGQTKTTCEEIVKVEDDLSVTPPKAEDEE